MNNLQLYLKEIDRYPILDKEEEKELLLKMEKGDNNAREKLINHNLKLVIPVAKRYIHYMDMEDLIGHGNIGLTTAADLFKVSSNFDFSTYATKCIESAILRAIKKQGVISLPEHEIENVKAVKYAIETLTNILGREPDNKEISIFIGFTIKEIDKVKININIFCAKPLPLDAPITNNNVDDENKDLYYDVEDERDDPATLCEKKDNIRLIKEAISNLKPEYQQVIMMKFYENKTRNQIAEIMGVSPERIRQIEEKSYEILRKSPVLKMIMKG